MTITHHPALSPSVSTASASSTSAPSPWAALARRTLESEKDPAATLARVALGAILFPHGAQHALGWFGGYGFSGTLGWMTGTLGFPAPLAALGIVTELVAPVLMLLGVGGRATAAALLVHMAFASSPHWSTGFFMNWFGAHPAGAEGFEYHLLAMALAAVVVVKGMGALSLDRLLLRRGSTSAVS
jgi:putative oxidoreductase